MILINEKISLKDIILKYILRDFFLGALDLVPSAIGVGLRLVFYPLFFKKCGKGFTLRDRTTILFPERITIGNNVGISHFCFIDGAGGIEIGDYTRIGAHVSIISSSHSFENPDIPVKLQKKICKGVKIGEDCWIGTGAKILDGVAIGKGSVVGAGSIVTKNTESYSVVAGVPARFLRKRK